MDLSKLIKYYQNCYQEDNRGTQIINIFSKSIENKYFFEGKDQLITGFLPYSAIADDYAIKTSKKIKIAEKERELVYCSVFVAGKSDNLRFGNNKICSPLFIYPAEIIQIEEDFFVRIDHEHRRINYSIFNDIFTEDVDLQGFIEELYKIVGENKIDLTIIALISKLFDKFSANIDTSELLLFPELVNKNTFQGVFSRKIIKEEKKFIFLAASTLAIIKKSINTRGIINELAEMSEKSTFSLPIKAIFANKNFKAFPQETNGFIPAILNQEQEQIIKTSDKFPFSVIIGPPGTGKSYTISALAIEKMSKGKSILIASGTDKAVDIIAEKIENQLNLKDIIVRAGRKEYKKKMINYVQNVLRISDLEISDIHSKSLFLQIKKIDIKINKAEKILKRRIKQELSWGKYYSENLSSESFFSKIKKKFIKNSDKRRAKHWVVENEMQKMFSERNDLILKYIDTKYQENLRITLSKDRQTVSELLRALKSIIGSKQEEYFSKLNFQTVFKVFPVWLVKMSDIYKVLPLFTEMFDYVIIDEATQCNIAQALPVLQRGKKVIVTGDPKQLRHFSFLSKVKQKIFRDKLELNNVDEFLTDYKNSSLLDAVSESTKFGEQFTSLYEHYRSLPAIIRFSNENFYENKLRIMTSKPGMPKNRGIELVKCDGERNKQGFNEKEAKMLLKNLKEIVEDEKQLSKDLCSSIGILSPFRDQVEYLSKIVTKEFSLKEIEKHSFSIQTAYGFQGDERDIMMLSFVVDNNSNATAYRYMNKADVFNVAITRARKMQYIYYSVDIENMKRNSLLRKYLESFNDENNIEKKEIIDDDFANDVTKELEKRNFQIWKNFKIAGLEIDLIAKKNDKIIGIDLIGFPGQFNEAFSIERYKMLTRAGINIFPLPYTYWSDDKEYCLNELFKII